MIVLGIDPGIKGGLAVLDERGQIIGVQRMPTKIIKGEKIGDDGKIKKTRKTVINWNSLYGWLPMRHEKHICAIEKQMIFRGKMGGSDAMIGNYWILKHYLDLAGISFEEIFPATWKAAYRQKGEKIPEAQEGQTTEQRAVETNRLSKEANSIMANLLWPDAADKFGKEWCSGTHDAALIAEYKRRKLIEEERGNP